MKVTAFGSTRHVDSNVDADDKEEEEREVGMLFCCVAFLACTIYE